MRQYLTALVLAFTPACAFAANPPQFKFPDAVVLLPDTVRAAGSAWEVYVDVEQASIGTTIDIGRVMPNSGGGGLLGALIIEGRYDNRKPIAQDLQQRAEATVAPIRSSLADLDTDAMALESLRTAFSNASWLKVHSLSLAKEPLVQASKFPTTEVLSMPHALLAVRYEFSPDFTQIRVVAHLIVTQSSKGVSHLIAHVPMISTVQLRNRAFEIEANANQWARDNAVLARTAVARAFAGLTRVLPRALALTAADVRTWSSKDAPKAFAAGFNGTILEKTTADLILWQDALVVVATLP